MAILRVVEVSGIEVIDFGLKTLQEQLV